MLYTFRFLDEHPIYGLHENIVYFFEQLFELDLPSFDETKHLKGDFINIAKKSHTRFIKAFKKIVEKYHNLKKEEKEVLKKSI